LATSIQLGAIVGLAGGIWFLVTITWLSRALVKGKGIVASSAALLTFPGFICGANWWGASKIVNSDALSGNISYYLLSCFSLILIINIVPCLKLMLRCLSIIEET
jgi:hypothetical protein